jgi:hypothetical protein
MDERSDDEQDAEPDAARRTRRRRVGMFLGILGLVAVPTVWGLMAGLRHREPDDDFSVSALILALTALVGILAALGLILGQLFNRAEYRRLGQYPRRRRMRVAKALRRGDPIDPDDLAVAGAVIAVMRKQWLTLGLQPVLIAFWIVIAFTRNGVGRWLYIGLTLVMSAALVYSMWVQRRTIRNWEALPNRSAGEPPDAVQK